MKYFVNSGGRKNHGNEFYVEFRISGAKNELRDESLLYMPCYSMAETDFAHFISHCIQKDILFDSETISGEEWQKLLIEAKMFGESAYEAICELWEWAKQNSDNIENRVELIWESERILAQRSKERETYPVNPEFYEEVKRIDQNMNFEQMQEEYEKLLDKYNMPSCFYSISLKDLNK